MMFAYLAVSLSIFSYRPREYDSDDGPWEPISGGASALLGTLGSLMMGVADFPVEVFKVFASKSLDEGRTETNTTKLLSSKTNPNGEQSDAAVITATCRSHSPSSSTTTLTSHQKAGLAITPNDRDPSGSTLHGSTSSLVPSQWSNESQAELENQSQDSKIEDIGGEPGLRQSPKQEQARKSTSRHTSQQNPEQNPQISFDIALGAGKGVSRIVGAGLKSPMDFTLGLARGFHNAPKLYGDQSVRQADKITGFQSGLRAAGKVCFSEKTSSTQVLMLVRNSATVSMMEYRVLSRNPSKAPRKRA